MKLGHEYFKFYLVKFLNYSINNCYTYNTKENPEHLILYCKNTRCAREELKKKLNIKDLSLKKLFNTKIGQEFLFKFIKKTQIATRKWLL